MGRNSTIRKKLLSFVRTSSGDTVHLTLYHEGTTRQVEFSSRTPIPRAMCHLRRRALTPLLRRRAPLRCIAKVWHTALPGLNNCFPPLAT